jgi:hypothetical protein
MKLIIDIPEDEVNECKMQVEMIKQEGVLIENLSTALKIHVANGTPLPKGHGRLIDADELKKHKYHDSNRHEKAVSVAQIDWQPTIIKADAESEGK